MVGEVKGVGRSRGRSVVVEFVKNIKKEESQKRRLLLVGIQRKRGMQKKTSARKSSWANE